MIGGDQNNSNLTSDEHHAATSPDVVAESGDTTDEEKANNIITNNTTNTDDKDEGVVSEEKGATDDNTSSTVIKYASNPLKYSIVFILILDFLERFAFNGIIFTMPGYLTGYYQPHWNPAFAPWEANSFIAMSQGIGYLSPFLVAPVADALIGDYWSINLFTGLFYIPGVFLIAAAAIPYSTGDTEFPIHELRIATHILFPIGFGAAKTLYGVYGAKQYDPVKHADQMENFFVLYTGVEFLGSFMGSLISIVLAETLKTDGVGGDKGEVIASFLNASAITLGLIIFLIGSRRYVNGKAIRELYMKMCRSLFGAALCCGGPSGGCSKPGFEKTKQSKGGHVPDSIVTGMVQVLLLVPIYLLVLPLNIAFTQVIVVNITMAGNLKGYGAFEAPLLVATGLLMIALWAFVIKKFLTPWLTKKNIKLTVAKRFSLGALSLGCGYAIAAIIESQIKRVYEETGEESVSIFYGLFGTFFSGGMAFAFSAMNEVAFTMSPPELKMLGTAVMLFFSQGVPNIIGAVLFKACEPWFKTADGNDIKNIHHYVKGQSTNFTYLMMGFCFFNVVLLLIPKVGRWIENKVDECIANNLSSAGPVGGGDYANSGIKSEEVSGSAVEPE